MLLNTQIFIRFIMNGLISLILSIILMFVYANLLPTSVLNDIQTLRMPMIGFDLMLIFILLLAMMMIIYFFQIGLKKQLKHQPMFRGYWFWINCIATGLILITLILSMIGFLNVITNLIMDLGVVAGVMMTFINLFKVLQTHQIYWYWWGITNQVMLIITFCLMFWLMPM